MSMRSPVIAVALIALALPLGGCVATVAGAAVGAAGAVAAGTVKATGKVAGATVGAGKTVVTGGKHKKGDRRGIAGDPTLRKIPAQ